MARSARLLSICVGALVVQSAPAAADQTWPTRVSASYKVIVAGFELGRFQFNSTMTGSDYALTGTGDMTWGFGMFHWHSTTRSSGTVTGDRVAPSAYAFDYKTNSKAGSVNIGFKNDAVSNVAIVPAVPPSAGAVPLQDHQLKAVFDPMSALIALARGVAGNATSDPCGRRISIFEGRQRFDLALSFRRQEKVTESRPSGQPGVAYVCRVQYIPVSGHKLNKNTTMMASNTGIEVAFRPVPAANMQVPSRITIPTPYGTAELLLNRVDIVAPGNRQIALTH